MELSFRLKKSPEIIFEYLTDMQKFVSVHPVIYKMDSTGDDTYLVHETLKVGFIPFSFTYPASVERNHTDHSVVIRATVMKFTKIEVKYVLKKDNDFTIIKETIQFNSLLPIKFILQNIFKKHHHQFFKNIEDIPH